MAGEKKPPTTVFEFIEEAPEIPSVLTVNRTTESRHQFHLLARALHRRLDTRPINLTMEKQRGALERAKATIEEPSVFDLDRGARRLFVLEGFSKAWAEGLRPPERTHVLAETEEGQLRTTPYSYRARRDALKAIKELLEHELKATPLSLRLLVKKEMNWTGLGRFEEYESLLRKAYLMEWTEARLGEELQLKGRTNLLVELKQHHFKQLIGLNERLGPQGTHQLLISSLADLIYYRALRQLGFDEARAQREMGLDLQDWRIEELEKANATLSGEEIKKIAERTVQLDPLVTRLGSLGVELLLLNVPIGARR